MGSYLYRDIPLYGLARYKILSENSIYIVVKSYPDIAIVSKEGDKLVDNHGNRFYRETLSIKKEWDRSDIDRERASISDLLWI